MSAGKHAVLSGLMMLVGLSMAVSGAALAGGLPNAAAADTVRTNLWLTEALMAEIVAAVLPAVPPAPGAIRLEARSEDDTRNEIFQAVAADILAEAGYELYVAGGDADQTDAADYVFSFDVHDIDLNYPAVGRTLGIWRRWIDRDLGVSVLVEISEAGTSRLLFSERMERRYGDRLNNDDFDAVDADIYDFTTAETSESGWQGRVEEIVVLGSLAGLVAIYFANTGK